MESSWHKKGSVIKTKMFSIQGAVVLCFLVTAVLIHLYFLVSNDYFTGTGVDAQYQFGFFQFMLHRLFSDGNFFWSWKYGLGGDLFGQFNYYYSVDPFFYPLLLIREIEFPQIFQYKLYVNIFKSFAAMLFMYLYLRHDRINRFPAVAGALIYGGSLFFVRYGMLFDYMVNALVFLPLLLWGFERFLREKKSGWFVFSLFLVLASNFYFAYITSLFLIIYALVRYISEEERSWKGFVRYFASIAGYYFLALAMAAFSFLPGVYSFLHADRQDVPIHIPVLFGREFYQEIFYRFFFADQPHFEMGFSILVFFLLIHAFVLKSKRMKSKMYLFVVMFVLFLIPLSYSVFNGMSYMQVRWLYLLIFAVAALSAAVLDGLERVPAKKWLLLIGLAMVLVMIAWNEPYSGYQLKIANKIKKMNILAGIALFTFALLFALLLMFKEKLRGKTFRMMMAGLLILNIVFINNIYSLTILKYRYGQTVAYEQIHSPGYEDPQEKAVFERLTQQDKDFYRIVYDRIPTENTPMLYWYNGVSGYQSLLPVNVHQFMKKHYNVFQHFINSPSRFKNLDRRLYLETVLGVKYYFTKEDFVPYQYELIDRKGNMKVYRNKNWLPVGFMYYAVFPESRFANLNTAQKDQLLITGAVVDRIQDFNMEEVDLSALSARKVKITKPMKLENVEWAGRNLKVGKNGQITVHIEELKEPGELLVELKIRHKKGEAFTVYVNDIQSDNRETSSIYYYPVERLVFNLGYDHHPKEIRIRISPGEYLLEDFGIYFNPYAYLEERLADIRKNVLRNVKYTEQSIQGVISAPRDGLLYLSVPYSEGWTVTVDGKKVPFYEVNHAFIGIPVKKGDHVVRLEYITPWFVPGAMISLIGFIVWFLLLRKAKKRKE